MTKSAGMERSCRVTDRIGVSVLSFSPSIDEIIDA